MQQGIGGGGGNGGGSQSLHGEISSGGGPTSATHTVEQPQQQLVEEASPISSRPPAAGNFDELIVGGDDEDAAQGVSSSNRWPRQETLTLLKIRSDMDAAFRDATVKGPLWEDVSRKLAELGYRRSAKKCREKFENVHKYYKRTKEGRSGRQDGKSYKFFSELEALQSSSAATAATPVSMSVPNTLDVAPISVGIPMPISSPRISPNKSVLTIPMSSPIFIEPVPGSGSAPALVHVAPPIYNPAVAKFGINFSPEISSSSEGSEDEDEEDTSNISRKRKRQSSSGIGSDTRRTMQFFERLMQQVLQKQEDMLQRFLEAVEKREQDRMVREEACKRQKMARLAREQELMVQEHAIAVSRDTAIVSFLQNITGQKIQLPAALPFQITPPGPPPTQTAEQVMNMTTSVSSAAPPQQQQSLHRSHEMVVMAVPEQTIPPQDDGGSGSLETTSSSRWPRAEVLALINIRSGFESRYQEPGPKGPLWEEVSSRMLQMGYKRSSKRCKEKWENINKYFKKVKESNKQRPEDAKTCPYFHQLDALYRKKILGGGNGSGGASSGSFGGHQQIVHAPQPTQVTESGINGQSGGGDSQPRKEGFPVSLFGDENGEPMKKPEDIMRELMGEQEIPLQRQPSGQPLGDHYMDEDEKDKNEEDDGELDEHRKMAYTIEFQRQNSGGGNGTPSFLTMVQ